MNKPSLELLTTFHVGNSYFGISVIEVQEVTGTPVVVSVPMAPGFVKGLINLRGQLATALDLSVLFDIRNNTFENKMSVVSRLDGNLVSLLVDKIGDVVEVSDDFFEPTPQTVPERIKPYIKGVYKMKDSFLSVIDLRAIAKELSPGEVTDSKLQQAI